MISTDSIYAIDNYFIREGFIVELREVLEHLTLAGATKLAIHFGFDNSALTWYYKQHVSTTLNGLLENYSNNTLARDIGPFGFYGGPELNQQDEHIYEPFMFIRGSLLAWVMDMILFEVSIKGMTVLDDIGIPL